MKPIVLVSQQTYYQDQSNPKWNSFYGRDEHYGLWVIRGDDVSKDARRAISESINELLKEPLFMPTEMSRHLEKTFSDGSGGAIYLSDFHMAMKESDKILVPEKIERACKELGLDIIPARDFPWAEENNDILLKQTRGWFKGYLHDQELKPMQDMAKELLASLSYQAIADNTPQVHRQQRRAGL